MNYFALRTGFPAGSLWVERTNGERLQADRLYTVSASLRGGSGKGEDKRGKQAKKPAAGTKDSHEKKQVGREKDAKSEQTAAVDKDEQDDDEADKEGKENIAKKTKQVPKVR